MKRNLRVPFFLPKIITYNDSVHMKTKTLFINVLFATLLAFALYYSYQKGEEKRSYNPYQVQFETSLGKKSIADFKGKTVLIYFGFLSCPDVCPTTLQTVTTAFKKLSPEEQEKVVMLFIDLDPERDKLENLKNYLSNFHPNIIPFSADLKTTKEVTKAIGIFFEKVPLKESKMGYTIDHSTGLLLLSKSGELITNINHGATSAEIVAYLKDEFKKP